MLHNRGFINIFVFHRHVDCKRFSSVHFNFTFPLKLELAWYILHFDYIKVQFVDSRQTFSNQLDFLNGAKYAKNI